MINRYGVLADRIRHELTLLGEAVQECEHALARTQENPVDRNLYVTAAALHLHDFYNGLERLFVIIASEIDQTVPGGSAWHRELLTQMTIPLTQIRPAVLTPETVRDLDEYLRFRHVVRQVYAFQLDAERVGMLVANVRPVYERVRGELEAFTRFLECLRRADESPDV